MSVICRKATPKDVEGLEPVMLVISSKMGERERVSQMIEAMGRDPQKYLLVAEDTETGELLGSLFGLCFEDICEDCRPILLVENVAVLEKCQGMGIGRLMFEEIERWAREEWNAHYEILASGLNRHGAHKFYNRLGFEEVKGFKKHF